MTDYSIGDAAEILRITTRTLRHWDHIGLLVPSWRTYADHRLYTGADLERALRILVYREVGLSLSQIAELLDAPGTAADKLRFQRDVLVDRIGQLHRMVRAVDELLDGGETMTMNDKIGLFGEDWPAQQEEAQERWGGTGEWEESQKFSARMTRADVERVKEEQESFVDKLEAAAGRGVEPGSEVAAEIVEAHRSSISGWYEMSVSRQVILARMYIDDERFNATYRGHAQYLLSLVEAQAEREGIDLADVRWE